MGATPVTENGPAGVADSLESAAMKVWFTALKVYAKAQVPFLGWPVISQVFDWTIDKVQSGLTKVIVNGTTYLIIDTQIALESASYSDATAKLKAAIATGDRGKIASAKLAFQTAAGKLIHFDGSHTPKP